MTEFTNSRSGAVDPFLLRFAAARSSEGREMPGHYSPAACLWVVNQDGAELPIVEIDGGSLAATQSKTMTWQEADDDDPGRGPLMETRTITEVKHEADDQDASLQEGPGLEELASAL